MSDHTPGPWQKWQEGERFEILYAGKDQNIYVGRIAKTYSHWREKADADLISAAPDLLEACKTLRQMIDMQAEHHSHGVTVYTDDQQKMADILNAAIEKAEPTK